MKKYSGLGLLFALCLSTGFVQAGAPQPPPKKNDSFNPSNTAPTEFSMATAAKGGPCITEGARANTSDHMTVVCKAKNGAKVWQVEGMYNVEKVLAYDYLNGRPTPIVLWATAMCPAGKKIVSGGCDFNGFATRNFDASSSTPNNDGWYCIVGLNKVIEGAWYDGVVSSAICADWQPY